ncbi:MAG: thiol oxidoreductase, partial [Methylobacterium sp.]
MGLRRGLIVLGLVAAGAAALPLGAGLGLTLPERTDLDAKDLKRVRAVTRPTADFSRPESFEDMQGGAGTSRKLVNRDSFSQSA